MTYGFYVFITLGIVIFQTSIMPFFPVLKYVYDLMVPLVIYLGIFRAAREGLCVIVFLGGVMDTISGAPFGMFFTCYLWLFILVKWIQAFLNVGSTMILPFVVALGILVENLIFLGMGSILHSHTMISARSLHILFVHMLWAICTGPMVIRFIRYSHEGWDGWSGKLVTRFSRS